MVYLCMWRTLLAAARQPAHAHAPIAAAMPMLQITQLHSFLMIQRAYQQHHHRRSSSSRRSCSCWSHKIRPSSSGSSNSHATLRIAAQSCAARTSCTMPSCHAWCPLPQALLHQWLHRLGVLCKQTLPYCMQPKHRQCSCNPCHQKRLPNNQWAHCAPLPAVVCQLQCC